MKYITNYFVNSYGKNAKTNVPSFLKLLKILRYIQVMYSGMRHLGYGFVNFGHSKSAFRAINALNGVVCYDRVLEVSIKTTLAERNLAKKVST